jgi:glycosyltransferase involved in cell wall biosynthesis
MPTPARRRPEGLVIAWMPTSRRSATIAERLGYELVLIGRSGFRRPWSAPLAYMGSSLRMVAALVRRRPRAAIIIAPPFLAPLLAWPFLAVLRAPFAIDVHSGALLDRRWRWSVGALAWVARHSVGAVVTLRSLQALLAERGVTSVIVPDPLPDLGGPAMAAGGASEDTDVATVVAICGWAPDEPLQSLVAAAAGRPWRLVLTGSPRQALDLPPHVELAGFLADDAYVARLRKAAAIVVLTTREDTLLSGAWEALAAGRPLVLSGTTALRETFGDGPAYVGDDPASIAAGIDAVLADPAAAEASTIRLRDAFKAANDAALAELAARLRRRDEVGGDGQSSSADRSADQAR